MSHVHFSFYSVTVTQFPHGMIWPLVKRGIPDVLFNSREEFYCSNNKLYKYKMLRCVVEQVKDG